MKKIKPDTLLSITYGDLRQMLVDFQMDGLNADGCSCSLHLDEDEEIQDEIQYGTIQILKGDEKNGLQ